MRGKVSLTCAPSASYGITPAHAGKSICRGIMSTKIEDHPRTCGEKACVIVVAPAGTGSPPHMRGKATAVIASGILTRITPAHAGKRCTLYPPQANRRDHPRTCGEKRSAARLRIVVLGSPPHMRGKVMMNVMKRAWERITPAHAGKRQVVFAFLPYL